MARIVSLTEAPLTTISVYAEPPMEETVGTVAMVARDHIAAPTMLSLYRNDFTSFAPKKVWTEVITNNILTLARNVAVQKMRGDWLLFIDDDMVWDSTAIAQLVASREEGDYDVLGALCHRRHPPYEPTLFMREEPNKGNYNWLEKWDDDIVEVDATGMAFCLIHKRVFEAIAGSPMPPPEARVGKPAEFFRWTSVFGEDLLFCQAVKEVGCRIFVDTRIKVGHISEVDIREREFLIEVAGRSEAEQLIREQINRKMGLPTLTKKEALERLGWS